MKLNLYHDDSKINRVGIIKIGKESECGNLERIILARDVHGFPFQSWKNQENYRARFSGDDAGFPDQRS